MFAVVMLTVYLLYRQVVSPSQVAQIASDTKSVSCQTLVESISFNTECGEGYFKTATYTCKNGVSQKLGGGSCQNSVEMIAEAQKICGQICNVALSSPYASSRPSPIPSNPPKPTDSPLPSGCYYQQVQCVQAPCEKLVVCNTANSPIPSPVASRAPSPIPSQVPSPLSSPYITRDPSPVPSPSLKASTSTSNTCAKQLGSWKYRESCGNGNYRYLDFTCMGDKDNQVMGGSSLCKSEAAWLNEAKQACRSAACGGLASQAPSPTPVATAAPKSSKQDFWSCYRQCRSSSRSFISCYRSCRSR